jgi:hypothetical protein
MVGRTSARHRTHDLTRAKPNGNAHEHFRPLRPRGRHHRRQWRHRPRHRAGAGRRRLQRLDLGPQRREEQGAAATMAGCPARSIPASATSAIPPRSRRRWPRRSIRSAASTAALPMPASAAADGTPSSTAPRRMAQHVRHQSRRRVPRVSGRRAPHDRARRGRRQSSAGWSRPRASPRCSAPRATSITPAPRPRSTRCAARSRSSWRVTASPRTRSCPAGSRAT